MRSALRKRAIGLLTATALGVTMAGTISPASAALFHGGEGGFHGGGFHGGGFHGFRGFRGGFHGGFARAFHGGGLHWRLGGRSFAGLGHRGGAYGLARGFRPGGLGARGFASGLGRNYAGGYNAIWGGYGGYGGWGDYADYDGLWGGDVFGIEGLAAGLALGGGCLVYTPVYDALGQYLGVEPVNICSSRVR